MVEAGRSPNIEILTKAELLNVEGAAGDFKVSIRCMPRYVNEDLCTGCGTCSQYCPVPIRDDHNEGLTTGKALHVDYQQAIPAAFHITPDACLFLTRKECKQCERVCHAKAIDFTQQPREIDLHVGAVILAPGFGRISRAALSKYGYGTYPDVITGIQLERLTSASGPTVGEVLRPSDKTHPKKIAFLQCVGTRDLSCGNGYCSTICCMYAVKEAMVVKEHDPGAEIAIFYMDMRTQGKEFDRARLRAEGMGIRFIRSRIGDIRQNGNQLELSYVTGDGRHLDETFEMLVLPEGLESPEDAGALAQAAGIELNRYDFCRTDPFTPLRTTRAGCFVAGAFRGPKDVPESVVEASAAAALAAGILREARGTRTRCKTYPHEMDLDGEPRIGVFICSCGTNIGGVVDVKAVAESAEKLEHVVFTETNLYSCAQNTQVAISERIVNNRLNRVVVAACTPRTHEPLFQETLKNAGLNRSLFEMANIRDHCSWVHAHSPEEATEKATDLVRMAVSKARHLRPLAEQTVPVTPKALVIGGGAAGMTAAQTIGDQGFECFLVEQSSRLGGNLRRLGFTLSGDDPASLLRRLEERVRSNPLIQVFTETSIEDVSGYVGNFTTRIRGPENKATTLEHGAILLATGGKEYRPTGYFHGQTDRIVTQLELEGKLSDPLEAKKLNHVVMIQCAGSRGEDLGYCSKVCCAQAVKNALKLVGLNPRATVTVLYRDMRTYGFMEDYYQLARERGVLFIPFDETRRPRVEEREGKLTVEFFDEILGEDVSLQPDLLVLSVGVVPNPVEELARKLKVPLTADGFFLEAHPKLRPVECSVDGIFLCGSAHSPKPLPEVIAQAEAAAGKACILMGTGSVFVEPTVASVDQNECIGCGICEGLCPYGAMRIVKLDKRKRAETIAASCKGCGICASHCPTLCIAMGGFTNEQIIAQIRALAVQG